MGDEWAEHVPALISDDATGLREVEVGAEVPGLQDMPHESRESSQQAGGIGGTMHTHTGTIRVRGQGTPHPTP